MLRLSIQHPKPRTIDIIVEGLETRPINTNQQLHSAFSGPRSFCYDNVRKNFGDLKSRIKVL